MIADRIAQAHVTFTSVSRPMAASRAELQGLLALKSASTLLGKP